METWFSEQREFAMGNGVFTKGQLKPSELLCNPANILLPEERLKNKYAALCYIRQNTTIPVPQIISFGKDENGSLKLVTGFVAEKMLEEFDDEHQELAFKAVDEQMERHIRPELHKLQRNSVGIVDGNLPASVPNPVLYKTMQPSWKRVTSEDSSFVFCHNDLSGHNIILDPDTCEIIAIVD
jgi:hypothetical protein